MKIATWNVNGIRARAAQLREWLDREQPDVVCLQELKAQVAQIPELCKPSEYHAYWHCLKAYSGVSMLLRKDSFAGEPVFTHPAFDYESRIVQVEQNGMTIISVYVPNGGKDYPAKLNFLVQLTKWVRWLHGEGKAVVLCGDINIAREERDVHPRERKPKVVGQLPEERALFRSLLETGLVDTGRHFEPDNDGLFTWWAPWRNMRQRNIGWRLDYVLASQPVVDRATGCVVQRDVGTSDHAPVVMTVSPD